MIAQLLARKRKLEARRMAPDAGVTLIEMLVVILIIGLITAIIVINVLPSQDTARVEKAKADIRALEQAMEMFKLDRGRYPTVEEGLDALIKPPAADAGQSITRTEAYIRRLPTDPWGRPYLYVSPGARGVIDIYSTGGDGREGGEGVNADIGNWS
jgi:general secretion pathway protein G